MSLSRYSRRALISRPGRTILTILSIVIGVTAVVAVTVMADTTREAYKTMFATVKGRASLEVVATNSGAFSPEIVARLETLPGIAAVVPVVEKDSAMTIGETRVRLRVVGVDPEKDKLVRDLDVVEGRFVRSGDEIMLESDFARQLGIKVGDSVGLTTPKSLPGDERGPKPMKVVGLVKAKGAEALLQTGLVFMPLEQAQLRFLGPDKINAVLIVTKSGVNDDLVRRAVAQVLPENLEVRPPTGSAQLLQQTLLSTNQGLRLTTAFSLLLAGFIILNTFLMNVGERRRHLAITRAIGATRWQLAGMLIREALLLGLVGTVLGIGVGLLAAKNLNVGLAKLLDVSLPSIQLSIWPFVWAVIFGFAVSLVGALVPVLRVARLSPLEGMSRVASEDFSRPPAFYVVIGVVLTVVSTLLIFGGTFGYLPIIVPTFAALGLHLGIVLLFPLVLGPLAAVVDSLLVMLSRAERSLALKQILRHRGRTSLTVGVLFIAGSTGLSMAHSILDNVRNLHDWKDRAIIGDYYIRAMIPDMATGKSADLPEELDAELQKVPGIAHIDRVKLSDAQIGDYNVIAIAREFNDKNQLPLDLSQGDPKTVRKQLAEGQIVMSTILAQKLRVKLGDEVELGTTTGSKRFRVAGLVNEYLAGGLSVYMDWQTAVRELGITGVDGYAIRAQPGHEEELAKVLEPLARKYGVLLHSKADISKNISRMSNGISGSLWGLVFMGFIVSAFGVVNTLSMNVLEQTRELGLLRIVAMTKKQVRRTIVAQAVIIGAVGLLPGILFGYGVAYMMNLAMEPSFGRNIQFHHRPLLMIGTFTMALVITLLAAWIPARRAAAVDLATALHYE